MATWPAGRCTPGQLWAGQPGTGGTGRWVSWQDCDQACLASLDPHARQQRPGGRLEEVRRPLRSEQHWPSTTRTGPCLQTARVPLMAPTNQSASCGL